MTMPIAAAAPAGGAPAQPAPPRRGLSFHDVLSALNPLQYLPVVGTIYRAVTGDVIPDAIRRVGSLLASGLLGGPIGVAINLATMAAEKVTGIDLDRTGQAVVRDAVGDTRVREAGPSAHPAQHETAPVVAGAGPLSTTAPTPPQPVVASGPAPAAAWTLAQLAAYGVSTDRSGEAQRDRLHGADVLNALELSRLHAAYARVALNR